MVRRREVRTGFPSDTWQPSAVEFPDAEKVVCAGTRILLAEFDVPFVGRELPGTYTRAIVWNRVGGADPVALMQCRVFAPTDQAATDLARQLAARMRMLVRLGLGIVAVAQNEGPTDLGPNPGPMRQLMYDITLAGLPLGDVLDS